MSTLKSTSKPAPPVKKAAFGKPQGAIPNGHGPSIRLHFHKFPCVEFQSHVLGLSLVISTLTMLEAGGFLWCIYNWYPNPPKEKTSSKTGGEAEKSKKNIVFWKRKNQGPVEVKETKMFWWKGTPAKPEKPKKQGPHEEGPQTRKTRKITKPGFCCFLLFEGIDLNNPTKLRENQATEHGKNHHDQTHLAKTDTSLLGCVLLLSRVLFLGISIIWTGLVLQPSWSHSERV